MIKIKQGELYEKETIIYTLVSLIFIVLGSIFQNDLVWELTDFFNYLMVLPNVLALFCLSKVVVNEIKQNGKKSIEKNPNQPLDDKISK